MMEFEEWLSDNEPFASDENKHNYLKAWNAAKELYQPKWISVNDRLPVEEKTYFVKTDLLSLPTTKTYLDIDGFGCIYVTHWMELPNV